MQRTTKLEATKLGTGYWLHDLHTISFPSKRLPRKIKKALKKEVHKTIDLMNPEQQKYLEDILDYINEIGFDKFKAGRYDSIFKEDTTDKEIDVSVLDLQAGKVQVKAINATDVTQLFENGESVTFTWDELRRKK